MNLTFGRNVLSVLILVAFAADIILGNGVGNWWDWLNGFILIYAGGRLTDRFDKYHGTREMYRFDVNFISDVLDILIVALLIIRIVVGGVSNWTECLIGAGVSFALRNLILTFLKR